ncbi:hypothetical protein Zmor_011917 [Zophobas morio]|uniref:Uncharacterized protein n=1 Tax=Zophobas morio TaxID=2755281 RepID=A0AA38HLF5_9CUCU|nr:hypothetical protein Zmor_011917 [Zophobas morio]
MKLRTDYQDIDIAGDKNNVQEVLNSILDDSHVVNTDFIKSLRTFTDKVVEPEDGADYDYRLTYDIVSTGYNKDHPLGAQRLSQASGMENEDFTGTMHDLFYRYVDPDNAETKTDISGMKKKLGKIPFEGDAPTPDEVLKAFNKTNGTNISNKEADVTDIDDISATITITKSSNYKGSIDVTFEQGTATKTDIKDVIKVKELGEFDKQPASKDILAAINTANPDAKLKSSDVTIGSIDDVSAKVTGQGDYTGEVKVTFTIKDTPTPPDLKKLSEDLTEPNIGTIKDEEEQTILDAVKEANPNVVISELTANSTNDGHADISVKSGSEVYEPDTMQVNYELEKKDIADVISDTPLGELTDNNDDTIVTEINNVNSTNLKLNTDISISDKTETGATITGMGSYTGTTTVEYTIKDTPEPVELNTVVNDTELGELADYNSETIKAEVVAQNEGIDETQIEVTGEPTETEATISAVEGSEKYTGSVNVSYTVKEPDPEPTPLENAIGTKELGDVEAIDKDSILAKVKEFNPDLVKDQIEIKEDPTETQATISAIADSTVYSGDAVVTYTYKPADTRQDLKTLIVEPNLGDIQTDDDTSILAAVTAKNPDVTIDPNEVKLVTTADGNNGQSVITANDDSEVYKGTVTVTFTLPDKRTDITTLFDETNVTDIDDASAETI